MKITHAQVTAACEALGLDPSDVVWISITPRLVVATRHPRNESGRKYMVDGDVAREMLVVRVSE